MTALPDYAAPEMSAQRRIEALRIMRGLPKRIAESLVLAACDKAIAETGTIDRGQIVTHLMKTHPDYFGIENGAD